MSHQELFWVLAQLAIGIGGFTGLISVLVDRPFPAQRAAMRLMFEHTFGCIGFSLLPSILMACRVDDIWAILSTCLALFYVYIGGYHLYLYLTGAKRGLRPRIRWLFIVHLLGGSLVLAVLQAVNALSWREERWYLIGVAWLLTPLAVQFLLFLNRSVANGGEAEEALTPEATLLRNSKREAPGK